MSLPDDREARNALPIWDAVIAYFPDTWPEIAKVSVLGNEQHNLGADKLYFNREVSTDHLNKVMRHLLDHEAGNVFDTDSTRHLAKAAWRILAALQVSIEENAQRVVSPREEPTPPEWMAGLPAQQEAAVIAPFVQHAGVPLCAPYQWSHAFNCPAYQGRGDCNCRPKPAEFNDASRI